jgi:ABC-type glycerol-3-phosphate transport system permease component
MSKINEKINRKDVGNVLDKIAVHRGENRVDTVRRLGYFVVALVLALLFFFPFYWLIKVAATWPSGSLYAGTPSLGLESLELYNFIRVYYEIPFPRYLFNSIVITMLAVVGSLVTNSLAAYSLTKDFVGKKVVMAFMVAALMIPYYVTVIPAFLLTNELGLLNTHLGVALPFMTFIIGTFILKNSFDAIPDSMLEAARLDGASEIYVLFGVMWRLAKPALATNVILAFIQTWNAYLWPLVVVSDRKMQPLPLALASFTTRFDGNFALQYAFAIMVLVPVVIMFLLLQKQFIRSVVQGSVKE